VQLLMQGQRQQLMQQITSGMLAYQPQRPATSPVPTNTPAPPPGLPARPATLPGAPVSAPPTTLPGTFGAQSAPPAGPLSVPEYGQQNWTQQPPAIVPGQGSFPTVSEPRAVTPAGGNAPAGFSSNLPPVASTIAQYFLPNRITVQQSISAWQQQTRMAAQFSGGSLVYRPVLLAQAIVRYADKKASVYTARYYAYHVPDLQKAGILHWEEYLTQPVDARSLSGEPFQAAFFGDLAPGLTDNTRMTALKREVVDMLYNTARMVVPFNPELKVYGNPDTDPSQFQTQVAQVAREQRDAEVDALSVKYGGLMDKLEDKIRKTEASLRSDERELADRRREELYTTGEALLSLFQGRTNYTLSRMSRATRYRRQTKDDLSEGRQAIAEVEREMGELENEFEVALQAVNQKWAQIAGMNQEYIISPLKKDIQLELFGIGWVPYWYAIVNGQPTLLSAF
jgi:hypothetical protein